MAYDEARRTMLLFGGGAPNADPLRLDTWTWDGKSWSELHPSAWPPTQALITYDVASGSLLMFSASTYSWDGRTWIDLHPPHSPSVGIPAFIAYDAAHGAAVVVTIDLVGRTTTTWTWNGADWQQQHPVHQPSGFWAMGAYDAQQGVIVALIGDQTWLWNGADWAQQHPARSPDPRSGASAAYDPAVGKLMLFGGRIIRADGPSVVTNELWSWDGTNWTREA